MQENENPPNPPPESATARPTTRTTRSTSLSKAEARKYAVDESARNRMSAVKVPLPPPTTLLRRLGYSQDAIEQILEQVPLPEPDEIVLAESSSSSSQSYSHTRESQQTKQSKPKHQNQIGMQDQTGQDSTDGSGSQDSNGDQQTDVGTDDQDSAQTTAGDQTTTVSVSVGSSSRAKLNLLIERDGQPLWIDLQTLSVNTTANDSVDTAEMLKDQLNQQLGEYLAAQVQGDKITLQFKDKQEYDVTQPEDQQKDSKDKFTIKTIKAASDHQSQLTTVEASVETQSKTLELTIRRDAVRIVTTKNNAAATAKALKDKLNQVFPSYLSATVDDAEVTINFKGSGQFKVSQPSQQANNAKNKFAISTSDAKDDSDTTDE